MQTECRNRTLASLSAVLLISGFFLWVCVKNEVNDGQIWALVLTIVLLFLFFGALYVSGYKENREKLFRGRGDPNTNNPRLRPLTRSDPGHQSAQDRNVGNEDGYRIIPLTDQRPVSSATNRHASVPVPVPVLHIEENFSESQREMGQRSRSPSGSSSRGSKSPLSHHMESMGQRSRSPSGSSSRGSRSPLSHHMESMGQRSRSRSPSGSSSRGSRSPISHHMESMGQRSRSPSGSSSRGSRSPISHHMESIMFPLKISTSRSQIHYSRLDHFVEELNPNMNNDLVNADSVFNDKKNQENEHSEFVPQDYRLKSCSGNDDANLKCALRTF